MTVCIENKRGQGVIGNHEYSEYRRIRHLLCQRMKEFFFLMMTARNGSDNESAEVEKDLL